MRYVFSNIPLKTFLEGQMSKDKYTPLVARKNILLMWRVLSLFRNSRFSVQDLVSTNKAASHYLSHP